MQTRYETILIVTPVLSDVQAKEALGNYKSLLKEAGAKIIHEENWGLRKLAYPIQKKSNGFYYLVEFDGNGEVIQKLEVQYRRDERIIRFLTVKMDKHAIGFAEHKRKKAAENVHVNSEKVALAVN